MRATPNKCTDNISQDKNRMNSPSLPLSGSLQRRSTADKNYFFEIQIQAMGYHYNFTFA
jgi:hypothetical protein